MQIKQDLEISISSPANSLVQDIQLSLDIWIAIQWCKRPVPDRDPDMVEAILANLIKIVFSDPGVPVILQSCRCSILAEGLRVSVLVNDCLTRSPGLEDGWSNPRLKDEPAAQVDTTNFVVLVVEGYITLAKAA